MLVYHFEYADIFFGFSGIVQDFEWHHMEKLMPMLSCYLVLKPWFSKMGLEIRTCH